MSLDAWADELVAGRYLHTSAGWVDMASGAVVHPRAWLIDRAAAALWVVQHADAHDAVVLSGTLGWVGVRVEARLDARARRVLRTRCRLSVAVRDSLDAPRGDDDDRLEWGRLLQHVRQAGVVPVVPRAMRHLSTHRASWWGAIGVYDGLQTYEPADRAALRRFRDDGGDLIALQGPHLSGGRSRPWQGRDAMRDIELLELIDGMDQAADERAALQTACGLVRARLRAGLAGISDIAGAELTRDGDGPAPPREWLVSTLLHHEPQSLSLPGAHAVAAPARDATGAVGVMWAVWTAGAPAHADACNVLSVCARLTAGRIAGCVSSPVPIRMTHSRLIGDGPLMSDVRAQLTRAARSPFPILLLGESGSGKELAARTIHESGTRVGRRFVAVNCAALPDELVDAELFGHGRGAFTGAVGERAGVFEDADGGTLFLDEVGDLSLRAQAKLLRVLQDGEVRRLGENGSRRVDVRIVAATNVRLDEAVADRRFRADLYYRLAVVCIHLPALRDRQEDIPDLVAHIWADCARRVGTSARLHPSLVRDFQAHDWPGNVRELQNALAALAVNAPRRGLVRPSPSPARLRPALAAGPDEGADSVLEHARRQFDASLVREALARAGGRRTAAARHLGLSRQGLSKLVRRLGLDERPGATRVP